MVASCVPKTAFWKAFEELNVNQVLLRRVLVMVSLIISYLMHEGGANNCRDCVIMHEPKASALWPRSRPLLALPECVKPRNSRSSFPSNVWSYCFSAKCALRNLEHGKAGKD